MPKQKVDKPIIIGFDESNNGWGTKSKNPHYNPSMIFTGYLDFNQNLPKDSIYKRKIGLFGYNGDIETAIKKANDYFSTNSDFFYTSITKEYAKLDLMEFLKAKALVTLTLKFILKYNVNPNELGIITDEFDGPENSKRTHKIVDWWFEKLKINIPHTYKRNADSQIRAVVRADRVSYYLGAIHHLGDNHKWPYRHRKVNLKDLEKLAVEFTEMNDTLYPDF